MKKCWLLILFIYAGAIAHSQTWDEWFRQKRTQKKYLLEQIAALQVYIDYAEKGYKIVSDGLHTIQDIKQGDFDIHNTFFSSLKTVNPKIKKYVKVAEIVAIQLRIIKETGLAIRNISDTKQFTTDELDYCKKVFDNLLTDCLNNIDELTTVLASNELELKDDERIKRIDGLYADMQNKYAFSSHFADEMGVLAVQRLAEGFDIQKSEIIYGLK